MKYLLLKTIKICSLVFLLSFATSNVASAQCPMCKMSAESNMKAGGSAGAGLNQGIIYMLGMPYILIGVIGYVWWRNRKKEEEDSSEVSS